MNKSHVLDVLREASHMSSEELDCLMREKMDDKVVSVQKENIRIAGAEAVVRRVFVRMSNFLEYATVGWVMNEDIEHCMTCSKSFWFFHSRIHCHACGNINCSGCAGEFCLVEELPDQSHGVPVCTQCFWGQEPVAARHRKGVDDVFQAATSRWTESSLRNSHGMSFDNDTESVDSFQHDHKHYDSDSTTDSVLEARLHEEEIRKKEEEEALRRLEQESNRKERRLHEQRLRTKLGKVHFDSKESLISEVEYISDETDKRLPEPLFVMKTTRHRSTKKIYINVCTLNDIDMVLEFGCSNGLYINGTPIESDDKYTGDAITIFDVLVNTVPTSTLFYDKNNVNEWMDDVCLQIIEMINVQCYEDIEESLPTIPKKKYKGTDIKSFDVAAATSKHHVENTIRLHEETLRKVKDKDSDQKDEDNDEKSKLDSNVIVGNELEQSEDATTAVMESIDQNEEMKRRSSVDEREKQERIKAEIMLANVTQSFVETTSGNESPTGNRTTAETNKSPVPSTTDKKVPLDLPLPTPLFVIKTRMTPSQEKVFINVCTLRDIDIVDNFSAHNGLLLNGEAPVLSADKSGETCYTFDILVNTAQSSGAFFEISKEDQWKLDVSSQIMTLVNKTFETTLEEPPRFPKIKGNYKGEKVRPYGDDSASISRKLSVGSEDGTVSENRGSVDNLRKQFSHSHAKRKSANVEMKENEYITEDDLDFLSMQTITPLFVIKTKRRATSDKVFVNVCTLPTVDIVLALSAKRGILLNGKDVVESVDKSGDVCFTYDVFVNTFLSSEVHYDVDEVNDWKEDVGEQIINLISSECNENLELNLKFPKIKGNYKGDVMKPFTATAEVPAKVDGEKQSSHRSSLVSQIKRGWLRKQSRGGLIKNWKKRYFVLAAGELTYYEEQKDTPPFGVSKKGCMDLIGAEIKDKGGLLFVITVSVGDEKDLLLEAPDEASKKEWMAAINSHIESEKHF